MTQFAFADAQKVLYDVAVLCRLFGWAVRRGLRCHASIGWHKPRPVDHPVGLGTWHGWPTEG
jgi:hypothetical protein